MAMLPAKLKVFFWSPSLSPLEYPFFALISVDVESAEANTLHLVGSNVMMFPPPLLFFEIPSISTNSLYGPFNGGRDNFFRDSR
jgi:hypothetical protein